jgi:hypothetical protein
VSFSLTGIASMMLCTIVVLMGASISGSAKHHKLTEGAVAVRTDNVLSSVVAHANDNGMSLDMNVCLAEGRVTRSMVVTDEAE